MLIKIVLVIIMVVFCCCVRVHDFLSKTSTNENTIQCGSKQHHQASPANIRDNVENLPRLHERIYHRNKKNFLLHGQN